uniref:Leucine-rich repeat protein kinase n=1 Tax=Populus alba TaxID=43335 RepID=A0A4U5Q9G1_POPAL|nr:leucine-rich repeat protein kinase [Populus alba]
MGVLPSDQWRTSPLFFPNYCILLSSISPFLPGNELTGTMPEAFAQLPDLTILYLIRNKLTGAVPHSLKENSNSGWLQLSLDGNLDLFKMDACEKKQQSLLVLVIASVISVSMLLLLSIIAIFWRLKRHEFFLNLRYHMIL